MTALVVRTTYPLWHIVEPAICISEVKGVWVAKGEEEGGRRKLEVGGKGAGEGVRGVGGVGGGGWRRRGYVNCVFMDREGWKTKTERQRQKGRDRETNTHTHTLVFS